MEIGNKEGLNVQVVNELEEREREMAMSCVALPRREVDDNDDDDDDDDDDDSCCWSFVVVRMGFRFPAENIIKMPIGHTTASSGVT